MAMRSSNLQLPELASTRHFPAEFKGKAKRCFKRLSVHLNLAAAALRKLDKKTKVLEKSVKSVKKKLDKARKPAPQLDPAKPYLKGLWDRLEGLTQNFEEHRRACIQGLKDVNRWLDTLSGKKNVN
jgi:translation initiation factor 2B subunit (eIF-2B alpha/beta/delta family)